MQILSFYERQQIEYYRRLKLGIRDISRRLKRDPAVISRENQLPRSKLTRYDGSTPIRQTAIVEIDEFVYILFCLDF